MLREEDDIFAIPGGPRRVQLAELALILQGTRQQLQLKSLSLKDNEEMRRVQLAELALILQGTRQQLQLKYRVFLEKLLV